MCAETNGLGANEQLKGGKTYNRPIDLNNNNNNTATYFKNQCKIEELAWSDAMCAETDGLGANEQLLKGGKTYRPIVLNNNNNNDSIPHLEP